MVYASKPTNQFPSSNSRTIKLAKKAVADKHEKRRESPGFKTLRAANDMVTRKSKYGVYVNGKLRTASDDHSIAMGVAGTYMAQGDSVWVAKTGTFVV